MTAPTLWQQTRPVVVAGVAASEYIAGTSYAVLRCAVCRACLVFGWLVRLPDGSTETRCTGCAGAPKITDAPPLAPADCNKCRGSNVRAHAQGCPKRRARIHPSWEQAAAGGES